MDRGTDRGAPPRPGAESAAADHPTGAGRVPLAVVAVDREGLVSHWSTGARRLFGVAEAAAVGQPALDLLPVSGALPEPDDDHSFGAYREYGAYDGLGPGLEASVDHGPSHPSAGRARLTLPHGGRDRDRKRVDVLWWAYPLAGPGRERLLVLAVDVAALYRTVESANPLAVERIAPGFAPHTGFPGAGELARGLPGVLPGMSAGDSARVVAQILELGYPVLEFSQNDRVPVTPDWRSGDSAADSASAPCSARPVTTTSDCPPC